MFNIQNLEHRTWNLELPCAWSQPVSSKDLIGQAKDYDNKIVEYRGEAIGDVMKRGDSVWINLSDGRNAIGVWGKFALVDGLVKHTGDYGHRGDILYVRGMFHRACAEHGGDLDIHFTEIAKLKDGYRIIHPVSYVKLFNAIGLFIIAIGLAILCRLRAKRK